MDVLNLARCINEARDKGMVDHSVSFIHVHGSHGLHPNTHYHRNWLAREAYLGRTRLAISPYTIDVDDYLYHKQRDKQRLAEEEQIRHLRKRVVAESSDYGESKRRDIA